MEKDKPEYLDTLIQVDLSLRDLLEIHRIIGKEIEKADIFKANDLMRIVKEIEEKTNDHMGWY